MNAYERPARGTISHVSKEIDSHTPSSIEINRHKDFPMPMNTRCRMAGSTAIACLSASFILSRQVHATEENQPPGVPNSQMAEVLDIYKLIAGTPVYDLVPQDARQQFAAEDAAKSLARLTHRAESVQSLGKVIDGRQIPGPASALPIRIYVPTGAGPFPVVVYFHGGGFVIATIDTYDASARALASKAQVIIVSVEYRKGPEARFPAAVDDALAAYRWTVVHAESFGGDAAKIAVAGESAGGNLATVVCRKALEQGIPMPKYQLLIYPVTDFANTNYPSDLAYASAQPLNLPALKWFGAYYLDTPTDAKNPDVSPLYASLKGLPPATIIAAQIDPLVDQGKAYADKLKAAGVAVHYVLYPGVTHEFFGMGSVLAAAVEAEDAAAADLKRALQ